MISINKFTRSILVFSAITISLLTANSVDAKDFTVGIIKKRFSGHGYCVSFLSGSKKYIMIIPYTNRKSEPVIAWMNINGRDLRLRQVSLQIIKPGISSVATYRSNNLSAIVDSQTVKQGGERGIVGSEYQETVDRISIDYGGKTKVIKTNGQCN
jgi:hypothetical protein